MNTLDYIPRKKKLNLRKHSGKFVFFHILSYFLIFNTFISADEWIEPKTVILRNKDYVIEGKNGEFTISSDEKSKVPFIIEKKGISRAILWGLGSDTAKEFREVKIISKKDKSAIPGYISFSKDRYETNQFKITFLDLEIYIPNKCFSAHAQGRTCVIADRRDYGGGNLAEPRSELGPWILIVGELPPQAKPNYPYDPSIRSDDSQLRFIDCGQNQIKVREGSVFGNWNREKEVCDEK